MIRLLLAALVTLGLAGASPAQAPSPSPPSPPAIMALPTWPELIAKNYLPYHQLTTKDFPVNDSVHPKSIC